MNLQDLILENLQDDDKIEILMNEAIVPMNGILAFLTLKDEAMKKLKNIKASSLVKKEQTRAGAGITTGLGDDATVYKLTNEQKKVIRDIKKKYGSEIIEDVLEFRKSILAPYQLIKRLVKTNKVVSSKDKFGMTHAQFKNSLESGKKKIEKRSEFFEKDDDSLNRVENLGIAIEDLKKIREEFKNTGKIKEHIANRVLKYYDLGLEEFDIPLDDLRRSYDEIKRNAKKLSDVMSDDKYKEDPTGAQDLIKRNVALRSGIISKEDSDDKGKDLTKISQFKINNKFNVALGKYMLRRQILQELGVEGNNIYKKTYTSILNNLIEKAIERRKELLNKKVKARTDIEFNEIERKIFKPKPDVKREYSGDINDYVQIIRDEDFGDPKYIKRSDELIDAERKIENEIKRFERALASKMDKEDVDKLKRFRLINNLITVRELQSPDKLFKSPDEIKKKISSNTTNDKDDEAEE